MRDRIDRYEIKKEIGRGGMATVYFAHDPRVQRDVAIKVLLREMLTAAEVRERFDREARTIASLDHPAIVPVYDFGEDQGDPFIVMRYMSGGSLQGLIRQHGPLPLSEAAIIVDRIAAALDRAHDQGVIHRDLKPGNILFDQYQNAFLSDFGIVKLMQAVHSLTQTGSFFGTPHYMSPEQVVGEVEIDGRADVYALGVILYEMLSGQAPYHADTPLAIAFKHVYEDIPRVLDAVPGLPPQINSILDKALAKNRAERYQTAGDLSADLIQISGVDVAELVRRTGGLGRTETPPPIPREQIEKEKKKQKAPPVEKRKEPVAEYNTAKFPSIPVPLPEPEPTVAKPAKSKPEKKPKAEKVKPERSQVKVAKPKPARRGRPGCVIPISIILLPILIAAGLVYTGVLPGMPRSGPGQVVVIAPGNSSGGSGGATQEPQPTEPVVVPGAGGTKIVFSSGQDPEAYDIYLMLTDGSQRTGLTSDGLANRGPVWSPDGTKIAYRAKGPSGKRVVYVMNADGSNVQALTPAESENYAPSWSPDGSKIAFVSERDGNPEIYVMNVDGSNQVRITENNSKDFQPVWSPDGKRIAYYTNKAGGQDIYVMDADGNNPIRLTDDPNNDFQAAWSPDGSRIAFVSERDGSPEIYVMNADGSDQTRLTNDTAADNSPSWSPDGKLIIFVTNREGNNEIYTMLPDGTQQTRLTTTEEQDIDPAWQP